MEVFAEKQSIKPRLIWAFKERYYLSRKGRYSHIVPSLFVMIWAFMRSAALSHLAPASNRQPGRKNNSKNLNIKY